MEPLLATPDEDLLAVLHRVAGHPETRSVGVVDGDGVLIGVVPIVRLAEAVVIRIAPEAVLADISDPAEAAQFGHDIAATTVADVLQPPVTVLGAATADIAFRRMHANHLTGLYVVDGDGRPTGYLDLLELTMRFVEALEADRTDLA